VVAEDERERLLREVAAADEPFVVLFDQQGASRIALWSLGKISTTSARRLISRGLVARSLDRCVGAKP